MKVRAKRDPQTRKLIYYVVSVRPTPLSLALITGDILNNLRSALDHLAYHLIIVGGGTPDRQSGFPITDTDSPAQYKANRTRKVKGMRPNAIEAIDALKPYKGGNDTLWQLHRLNNIDKHRLLITVGSALRGFDPLPELFKRLAAFNPYPELAFDPADLKGLSLILRPTDPLCPLKADDELYTTLPDMEPDHDTKFLFGIAISEPKVIEGEPLLETLHAMKQMVFNIITDFKPLLI